MADILTTAWSVISPVLDIAVSVFKVLFNVVQTVFTGIANVVGSVWDKVKPIVEGIGNGLSWIADKIDVYKRQPMERYGWTGKKYGNSVKLKPK